MISMRMRWHKFILATLFGAIAGLGIGIPSGKLLYWRYDQSIATIKAHNKGAFSVAFSPDGKHVASAGSEFVRIWSLEHKKKRSFKLKTEFQPGTSLYDFYQVAQLGYTTDGRTLLSSSNGDAMWLGKPDYQHLRAWNIPEATTETVSEKLLRSARFSNSHGNIVSSDGKHLIADFIERTDKTGPLHLYSSEGTTRQLGFIPIPATMAFSNKADLIAAGYASGNILIWNLSENTLPRSFLGKQRHLPLPSMLHSFTHRSGDPFALHKVQITSLIFTSDAKHLLTAGTDGAVLIINLKTGKIIDKLTGHARGITSMSLSPDGKTLVTASYDQTLKLWNLKHLY